MHHKWLLLRLRLFMAKLSDGAIGFAAERSWALPGHFGESSFEADETLTRKGKGPPRRTALFA